LSPSASHQAQERIAVADRRHLGVVAMSAVALVTGLAVWLAASRMSDDGENAGTIMGILVASVGLVFIFPAWQTYLLARRKVSGH
jgi:hypothetical protein